MNVFFIISLSLTINKMLLSKYDCHKRASRQCKQFNGSFPNPGLLKEKKTVWIDNNVCDTHCCMTLTYKPFFSIKKKIPCRADNLKTIAIKLQLKQVLLKMKIYSSINNLRRVSNTLVMGGADKSFQFASAAPPILFLE